MGSDKAPQHFFDAVAETTLEFGDEDSLVAFGTEEVVSELQKSAPSHRLRFEVCSQVITMDDSPLTAIRQKKESSMMMGMRQLRDGVIDAFVSAGNTGALIASGAILLPMLPGVERPALLAMFANP